MLIIYESRKEMQTCSSALHTVKSSAVHSPAPPFWTMQHWLR